MGKYYRDDSITTGKDSIYYLPFLKKSSYDNAYYKQKTHEFDSVSLNKDSFIKKNIELNYDLIRGYGDDVTLRLLEWSEAAQGSSYYRGDIPTNMIPHKDILSKPIMAIHGLKLKRPFSPFIVDSSYSGNTYIKKQKINIAKNFIKKSVIDPEIERIEREVLQKYSVQDPFSLSDDERQQLKSEVDSLVMDSMPKDLLKRLNSDIQSPRAKQMTDILNLLMSHYAIHEVNSRSFLDLEVGGKKILYAGAVNNGVKYESCDPYYFDFDRSMTSQFLEDSPWCRYTRHLTVQEMSEFVTFTKDDLMLLNSVSDGSYVPIGDEPSSPYQRYLDAESDNIIKGMSRDEFIASGKMGHREWNNLVRDSYRRRSSSYDYYRYDLNHYCWVDNRILKKVYRYNSTKTQIIFKYFGENYVEKPGLDIKVEEVVAPQVFEAWRVGEGQNGIYKNMGPSSYAYQDLSNPYRVSLPYMGLSYSLLYNRIEDGSSLIDKGKDIQLRYNIEDSRFERNRSFNIGTRVFVRESLIPKNMEVEEYTKMVMESLVVPASDNSELFKQGAMSPFMKIDFSSTAEAAGSLSLLDRMEMKASESVLSNSTLEGTTSPYVKAMVNQNNIANSLNPTEWLFYMDNVSNIKTLNRLIDVFRFWLKNNKERASEVLGEIELAELDLDDILRTGASVYAAIDRDPTAYEILTTSKQHLMERAFNDPNSDTGFIIDIMSAKSVSELSDLARMKKAEDLEQRDEVARSEAEKIQQQIDMQNKKAQDDFNRLMELQKMKNKGSIERQLIDVEKFAKQNDIDGNKQHDLIQLNREKDAAKLDLERLRLEVELIKEKNKYEDRQKDRDLEERKHFGKK